jgi:hypothetical protein
MITATQVPRLFFSIVALFLLPHSRTYAATVSFRQGQQNYVGTEDTYLSPSSPNAQLGASDTIVVSREVSTDGLAQFTNIFGAAAGQIPLGSTINSATLTLVSGGGDPNASAIGLYRMLIPWSEASTWNSLGSGVQRNDVEASLAADDVRSLDAQSSSLWNVTASVTAWSAGTPNYGWLLTQTDSTQFSSKGIWSSEDLSGRSPLLVINYTQVPEPRSWMILIVGATVLLQSRFKRPSIRHAHRRSANKPKGAL